jgi:hypothetical protein
MNGDNIGSVRCETGGATTIFIDLNRGINEFNKGYHPRTNLVKDENGNFLADSYSILNRWKNYFHQLLIVHGVNDVRHTEIHTAEP